MMKGEAAKKLQKLVVVPGAAEAVDDGGVSTDPATITLEDRVSMRLCQNKVVHSAVMLEMKTNKRVCSVVGAIGTSMKDFDTEHTRSCRSSEGTLEWMKKATAGAVRDHLKGF